MTAADRRAIGYEPDFDIDMAVGAQAELFVANMMESLGVRGSVEVKYDAQYLNTGNVYLEYQCLRKGKWKPSGIASTKADFWAFVLGMDTFCFFIATETLKEAGRERWKYPKARVGLDRGSHPTKGVILPVDWLTNYAAKLAL
jgi:hypothetical protein